MIKLPVFFVEKQKNAYNPLIRHEKRQDKMNIVDTFGHYVERYSDIRPERARWLLQKGWEVQKLRQKAIRLRQQRREQVHKPCKRKAQRQLQKVLSERKQQGSLRSADKVQDDLDRDKDGVESKGRVAEVEAVYNGNAV